MIFFFIFCHMSYGTQRNPPRHATCFCLLRNGAPLKTSNGLLFYSTCSTVRWQQTNLNLIFVWTTERKITKISKFSSSELPCCVLFIDRSLRSFPRSLTTYLFLYFLSDTVYTTLNDVNLTRTTVLHRNYQYQALETVCVFNRSCKWK